MSEDRKRTYTLNEETGEVVEYIEWREGDILRTKTQQEYFFKKIERYSDKTDFIWIKFAYNTDYYAPISSENLTRLMYFATFCNSDCFVMQDLDIKSMLDINANQTKAFRDELFGRIIIKDKSRLYLKDSLFGKGKIGTESNDYIRLFTDTTRQLYKSCSNTSEHAYLSYFFRMMPFVNRQTNILCCNQQEQEKERVAYMTTTEFLNKIGKTHHSRIKAKLQTYRINDELVIGLFNKLDTLDQKGKYAVINPLLYYGGDRTQQSYTDIRKLFIQEKEVFLSSQQ